MRVPHRFLRAIRYASGLVCLALMLPASSADAAPRKAPGVLTCTGPFARSMSHASLVKAFGANNVTVQSVGTGEGETDKASVIFPRDKARRIDLDTVKFATGSAEIPMNQATSLRKVADAMKKILDDNPAETFLIEGHTDAVGSDDSNLILSDERAESVAVVLAEAFGIPPENLTTQGYGERYLKIRTEGPEQENRRVTIRRITPLVKPVASR